MIEVHIENKELYFCAQYPFNPIPDLSEKRRCIHCHEIITIRDYKVFKGEINEYICCPNAPECDGTIIDWFPVTNT